ncbi:hypothetical protein [Microlunatus soli]|uniref:Uncharacterized protein n=1 Tax=Microlunatus soli TaxID=630515 RepID=A0A1H1R954_9ACTN|nr:hypothetical protein [Microlunatus soli]SDS32228.1 hypothetical protein SAMN04489812_1559 [Microlunatus soli]
MSYGDDPRPDRRRRVDPVRVWAGGVATALVAGGVAFVGILVLRALDGVSGLHKLAGQGADLDRTLVVVAAVVVALLATGLLHLLLLSTPRAHTFFAWIIGLVVLAVVVQALVAGDWYGSVLVAALYLIIGLAIGSLLTGVGRTAVTERPAPPPDQRQQPSPYRPEYRPGPDDQPTRRLPPS